MLEEFNNMPHQKDIESQLKGLLLAKYKTI